MNVFEDTYLADILHDISQGLLIPTMVCIIALIAVSLFFLGQILVEFFSERRHYRQNMPNIINQFNDADYEEMETIVAQSELLRFQKAALFTASRNMGLPEEHLFALAQIEINKAEKHYKRRLAWTDTISKIAPLLGLMGTLIPLGPGIVSLGQGDTLALSQSLLVAFDATVCGLVCAIFALIVSKVRSGWYSEYIDTLESLMSCVVEKAEAARKAGVVLSTHYDGDAMRDILKWQAAQERAAYEAQQGRMDASARGRTGAESRLRQGRAGSDARAESVN